MPGLSCGLRNLHYSMWDLSFELFISCSLWDLVPRAGIELRPPALGAQSLSHWITREVPRGVFLNEISWSSLIFVHWIKNMSLDPPWSTPKRVFCLDSAISVCSPKSSTAFFLIQWNTGNCWLQVFFCYCKKKFFVVFYIFFFCVCNFYLFVLILAVLGLPCCAVFI